MAVAEFSRVALTEANEAMRRARGDRALSNQVLARAEEILAQAQALNEILDAKLAALGIQHRWSGTSLEIMDEAGEWQTGPDLQGPPALGIEHRWAGDVLEIKNEAGEWVPGPNLKGPMGHWLAETAFTVPRQSVVNASGAIVLDVERFNEFDIFLAGNVTSIEFANKPSPSKTVRVALYFWQDGIGGHAVAGWPDMAWAAGGAAPPMAAAPNVATLIMVDVPGSGEPRGFLVDDELE